MGVVLKISPSGGTKMHLGNAARRVLLPLALTALIMLGVSVPVMSLAAFLIVAVYMFIASADDSFALLFYLLPFACVFKTSPGGASMMTYLQLVLAFRLIIAGKKVHAGFLVAWLALLLYDVIGFDWQVTTLIKQVTIPLVMYCYFARSRSDFRQITLYYAWGLLVSSVLAQFLDRIPNLTSYVSYDRAYDVAGQVYRYAGMYSDPNYYSNALILTMAGMLLLITRGKLSAWYYLMCLAFIIFGAQTVSKSFILLLALVAAAYIYMQIRRRKYGAAAVVTVIILIALLLILSGKVAIFQNTLLRFLGGDLTTNRSNIWARYLEEFAADPLRLITGHGIGSALIGVAAHNTYIDFLYYYGVIGILVFAGACVCAFSGKKHPGRDRLSYIPLALLAISAGFLSMLMYYDLGFNLIYVLCALKQEQNRRLR